MHIWIDLSNSPHVPLFLALADEFTSRGHEVVWTARDYAQTIELARRAGLEPLVFGTHGGKRVAAKAAKFAARTWKLVRWARGKKIDLVVVHNSQEPLIAARLIGIDSVNLMDYEHHPGNHMSFRSARRLVVPTSFPNAALARFGVSVSKVQRFDGIKEDVYLADFEPDPVFAVTLESLGVEHDDILVLVRPHAPEALYHRQFENNLLDRILDRAEKAENVKVILLPRKDYQGTELRSRHPSSRIIIPETVLDGANLIASADLVVSGGGTMNREAAALGVPTATIFTGRMAAIDEYLIGEGLLRRISTPEEIDELEFRKKAHTTPRRKHGVRKQVADMILNNRGGKQA